MNYNIHNLKSIGSKDQQREVKRIIRSQIPRIEKIAVNYPKPLLLDIYINKSDRIHFDVSCIIKMKEGIVFVKERGDNVEAILYVLFDKLKVLLNKKINKERKEYLRKQRSRQQLIFNEHLDELQEMKEAETRDTFNQLVKILLNDVVKYIRHRIKSAEMTTAIKKGKFKLQEVLDDLSLLVYERLDEVPEEQNHTQIWLYQLADRILEKKFKEIEFERTHIEHLSEIVDAEYASLEEGFTRDADEEIIPLEELDEYEHQSELNMATFLYEDDENSLLDDLTLEMNKHDINRIIEKELDKLPVFERTIMDLYLINQMSFSEIAGIKKIPEDEIEAMIGRVSKDLKQKFSVIIQRS